MEHLYRAHVKDPGSDRWIHTFALADYDRPTCRLQDPRQPERWLTVPLSSVTLGAQVGIDEPKIATREAAWHWHSLREGWTLGA